MLLIDLPNLFVKSIIKVDQSSMLRMGIRRLVENIVASNPRVALAVLSEQFPEPDETVLEVLVPPEIGQVCSRVGMPSTTLTAWCGVDVDNGIDGML